MNRDDWLALAQTELQDATTGAPTAVVAGPAPSAEGARLAALHEYGLLDTPADDELSAVVRAAAVVAGVPHATLNLIDEHRQCQLTTVGFEGADSARADSMCALHFEDGEVVHVTDASLDGRYARNPWVDGRLARVRFYASAPLVTPAGHALGSLCVFDTVPGSLSERRLDVLRDLAGVLVALFERRRQVRREAEQRRQAAEARELAVLAMAESEARWELSEVVAETVDTGLVTVDADGQVTSLNRAVRQWQGPSHLERPTYLAADGATALEAHELPWLRALREGAVQGAEVVLAAPGRAPRTLVCSGRAMSRADGTPLGAVVALNDVTRDRERERALAEAHAETERAHAAIAQAHAALEQHTRRVQALADASRALAAAQEPQEAVCTLLRELTGADAAYLLRPATVDGVDGLRAVALSNLHAGDVFYPATASSLAGTCFTSSAQVFVADVRTHPLASRRHVESSGVVSGLWQPVVLPGQRTVGVLGVFWRSPLAQLPEHDVLALQTLSGEVAHAVERADLLQRLERAAERDPLTGLANRRRWDEAITGEVARAARTGAPLSVALLDLDRFKAYNDTYGHLGGDVLLREFAAAAADCLREVDTLARWGGEEFVLALPGCTAEAAVAVADRIRAAVPRGQSCTVGIAQWQPGLGADDVIARADEALYRGKEGGRDATVVHGADDPVPVGPAA
ncbi:diguanylate cyclase domain-containing protein [Kineococcus rhizosphaerae]|uniref:diguanylate cyclase domain-containing protein n=1 Tax=Kineococcus rhizosphaerae TaxID=559628 RepID=UPI0011B219B6|nr:diguanylate cyclase [Kineococcus rhizosphaerae]